MAAHAARAATGTSGGGDERAAAVQEQVGVGSDDGRPAARSGTR